MLTYGIIQRAVQEILGTQELLHCRRVTEGGDHQVWYVGSKYVLRALLDCQASVISLTQEANVRSLVRKNSRVPRMIPAYVTTLKIDDYICNLDFRVEGSTLEEKRPTLRTKDDLTNLLIDLGSVPVGEAEKIGLPHLPMQDVRKKIVDAYGSCNKLVQAGCVRGSSRDLYKLLHLSDEKDVDEEYTRRLIHADFKGEHLFLTTSDDESDGTVCGVIDWSDAARGDIAFDLTNLGITVGRTMTHDIAKRVNTTESTIRRAEVCCMCDATIRLNDRINGEDTESPKNLLRSQFKRAFQGTALEDALI